ncbi:MAG: triose-phosphate isomerase [Chloroflexi bacterium HGW-Chloroflexi-1]|nr:MAG: triose-phosphate isomerase [Chloroflexi bacterium HGW-Chloroflexi-1]
MHKPILAGNWKMNKTPAEAVEFVRALRPLVTRYERVETVVCPPFVALPAVADALRGVKIGVGAQNVHWAESGAYTGEVAPAMLVGLAEYVIIGHSERRQYFAETDESVNKKIKAALAHGLKPIVCVGENLAQNEAGETEALVRGQVRAAFAGLTAEQARGMVIAYEPIWAIGTGRTATSEVANRVCGLVVRGTIAELYGEAVAGAIRIQYGGSANEKNIGELMAMPDIDGALIGGASLKLDAFSKMVRITAEQW